jgi:hypothetical protein
LFGAVLYEALVGRPPFDGISPALIASKHVNEPPQPLPAGSGEIPERLSALVMRCLRKDPADRSASMHEVGEEIRLVRREIGGSGRAGVAQAGPGTAPPPAEGPGGPEKVLPSPASATGIEAWKEFLDRARVWAAREKSPDADMKLGELEFAIAGLVSAEEEMVRLTEAATEAEAKHNAARERFDRALGTLHDEETTLLDRAGVLAAGFEAATRSREEAAFELATARSAVIQAETNARGGRAPVANDVRPLVVPDEELLRAYRSVGEVAVRCDQALEKERVARGAHRECEDHLRDVRFQIDGLTTNAARAVAALSDEIVILQRQIAALDHRRGNLYRKLITTGASLPV